MKPLSFHGVALAAIVVTLCTSFTFAREGYPGKKGLSTSTNTYYYYYLADGDTYDGYYTVDLEIAQLEVTYNVYVDGNSIGGTLLASGYTQYGTPHTIWPSSQLFGHYGSLRLDRQKDTCLHRPQ